ncbi:MAG: cytochrome c [Saprospiraceae bacterium]|nr:cytochrome c [Saprospiraceae bacterium]
MKTNHKLQSLWKMAFLIMFMSFIGCDQGPREGTREAQALRGKAIFAEQCSPCHGMDDQKPTRTDLEKPALDLRLIMDRRKKGEFPIEDIARIIDGRAAVKSHGPREMPVWGEVYDSLGMDKDEIRGRKGELVAYLMSIQQ